VNWQTQQLSDFITIKHGFAFSSLDFDTRGKYVVLTPGHFFEEGGFRRHNAKEWFLATDPPAEFVLAEGALIVAMTEQAPGLLGSCAVVPEADRYLHNQRLGLVTITQPDRLRADFLYHTLNSPSVRRQINRSAGGMKVRHTSPGKIGAVWFALPPVDDQRKIARVLNSLDAVLTCIRDNLQSRLHFKAGLTQQLLTGRKRFSEFVRCNDTQPGQYGDVPQDWSVVRISDIAQEIKTRGEIEGAVVYSCTKHRGLVPSLEYFGRQVFSRNLDGYKRLQAGDFAYATNHIEEGSIGLLRDGQPPGLVSPMYTVFRPKKIVNPEFLFALLKTESYRRVFANSMSASVDRRGSLRWKDFSRIKIGLPTLDEQNRIAETLRLVDVEIRHLGRFQELVEMEKRGLRSRLLPAKC
jgi:type I restriction enzyme S subunit